MKKLTKKRQIILYGCAGIGVNMLNIIVGSYLCSALLTGGFRENIDTWTFNSRNLVVAGLWSVLILVAKIVDGLIDIPMSSLTDNLRTKWGRRRPAIIIGFIPMIAAYLLFALVIPDASGVSLLNTVWYAAMLCVFYAFYTLTMVTYYATFSEIVDNDKDRSLLANTKSICDVVYFSISYALVPVFVNCGINIRIVALCAVPLSLTMIIPLLLIKEEPTDVNNAGETVAPGEARGVNVFKSLSVSFKNRSFLYWLCVVFVMNIGMQLFLSGINEFFSSTGISMIAVMASSFAPVPLTIMLYNRIVKKRGMRTGFQYVMAVFALATFLMFVFKPVAIKTDCTSPVISGYDAGGSYAVTIKVEVTDEEAKAGAENYSITETFTADENGNIDLAAVQVKNEHEEVSDRPFSEYAVGKTITVSEKKAFQLPLAICCGVLASFSIGAFFSFSYTIPAHLAAEENKRSGICASSMYFAVEGLFEGVAAGVASGPLLVFIKQHDLATYITLIVAIACVIAFVMAFFLPESISKFGRESENTDRV